ncbi:MAG: dihydrofolate reductase [Gammaproteobacteria bacterium]|jgi:dihydrofolate reductase
MTDPPSLTVVAAVARNGVIGRANRLPWHLPADLRHFKRVTLDRPVIMGRRTWESLPGLLPRRRHIVVTRTPGYRAEGAEVAGSLEDALALAGNDPAAVIGGAQLYAQALPLADRLLLTEIDAEIDGDTLFPAFDRSAWRETARESHPADDRNPYPYAFVTLRRITT